MADDEVIAVASELVQKMYKKGIEDLVSQTCWIYIRCRAVQCPAAGAAGKKVVKSLVTRRGPRRHKRCQHQQHGHVDHTGSRHNENGKCCKSFVAHACSI